MTLLFQLENDSSVEIFLNILNLKWHLNKKIKTYPIICPFQFSFGFYMKWGRTVHFPGCVMGLSDSMELSIWIPGVAGESGAEELSLDVVEVLWGSPSSMGSVSSASPSGNSCTAQLKKKNQDIFTHNHKNLYT